MPIAALITSVPFQRYRAIASAIEGLADRSEDRQWLRLAAQSAVLCPEEPAVIADAIRRHANALHDQADWFQGLNSPARFAVAALLVQHHLPLAVLVAGFRRMAALLKSMGLPNRGLPVSMAVLLMHLAPDVRAVGLGDARRLRSIYTCMRRFPWWVTGPADLPLCAALAQVPNTTEVVVARAEDAYQQLLAAGLAPGGNLHTAACLLVMTGLPVDAGVARYLALKRTLAVRGEARGVESYDDIAILALLDQRPEVVIDGLEAMVAGVRDAHPDIETAAAFTIACDLVFLDLQRLDRAGAPIVDAAVIRTRMDLVHAFHMATAVVTSRAVFAKPSA